MVDIEYSLFRTEMDKVAMFVGCWPMMVFFVVYPIEAVGRLENIFTIKDINLMN